MIKKYSPLIISLIVLYSIVAILVLITLNKNDGTLTYPLDDTFIHMAISKNFAQHGIWGITKYEFSSTTSSPLYTTVLAAVFLITGPNTIVPLIFNIIFAGLLLFIIDIFLREKEVTSTSRTVILLVIVLCMPLPILVISGMEHILHTFFTIWFVYTAAKHLSNNKFSLKADLNLMVLAILLGTSRYEGLFTVFAVCCLLFLRRKFIYSIILGLVSILPLVIYGFISVKNGSYWLPNSVLLKGSRISLLSMAGIESLYSKPLHNLALASWLFTLSLMVLSFYMVRLFVKKASMWDFGQLVAIVFIVTLLFHIELAQVGWVYRYEAYLMCLGMFIIGILWMEINSFFYSTFKNYEKSVVIVLFLVLTIPIIGRGISALKFGPKASNNIFLQQYQMGRFLKKYYNEQSIAANDIGAINFLADLKILDIVGLGSIETAKAKRDGKFTGELVERLATEKGVKIAIVYDRELQNSPTNWQKVGEWKIENNVVGASDVVAFYAVDHNEAQKLKENLSDFTSKLPPGVTVKIFNK